MPPRPFYRSRLFWLGLPGLVFLLWAWLTFPLRDSGLRWRDAASGFNVRDASGVLRVRRFSDLSGSGLPNGPGQRGFSTWSKKLNGERSRHPAIEFSREEVPLGYRAWTVSISYWFLLLIYLAVWLATLAWRQRRQSRLLKLHETPPP